MAIITGSDIGFVDRRFNENLLVVAGVRVFGTQLITDGISSFTLDVTLARNALVRKYDIVVNADRARATVVNAVAQVRATPSPARDLSGGTAIVVDFGTPRTVSAVSVPSGMTIVRVTPWMGTAFGPEPFFSGGSEATAILRSELRTERLLVEATGSKSGDELAAQMAVVLPEAPSDLEIRIDGGAPVVTLSGPAQPGLGTALSDTAWNRDGERIVHLAEALGKLTGDPTRSENVTFKVVLTSRVPGKLSMRLAEPPPVLSYVRRVTFSGDTTRELSFTEEGTQDVPLESLPAQIAIEEISFTAAGTLPPERTIPPVGPGDADLADLVLDPDRAVCVQLRSTTGLAELTGIRLPLRAGSAGAEMRVLLWKNKEGGIEPLEPMPEAVSQPLELSVADKEAWTTFSFKKAVAITTQNPPWAVLTVSRGEVTYSLGASTGVTDPLHQNVIKRGAPTGPFKPLPLLFQSGTSGFGMVRGRMRLIGHAPKDVAVAPLIVSIVSNESAVEVTPVAKGALARLAFRPALAVSHPVLRAISRVPGIVTLRDIDVVSTT